MADHDFAQADLGSFVESLATGRPTPGGGAAAAVAGALGASLVAMLARLTLGRPKYAAHAKLMEAVAQGADETAARLLQLSREDAVAYDAVSTAYRMPQATAEEKASRAAAIQEALTGATEVPLRVMENCVEAIGLAKNAVEAGNPSVASDGASGAELCRAALKAASFSIRANLAGLEDEAYAKLVRTRMDEMLYMGTRVCTTLESFVTDLWR